MITLEKLTVADAKQVMDIIKTVHDQMEHKEWYVIDDLDYYTYYLQEENGAGYKAVDTENDTVGGVFVAIIPRKKELHLGYDIGLSDEECKKVVVMDSVAILPAYRGQNLQYRLMQATEADLRERGYRYLIATVHPDNQVSLNNCLKQGYKIMATKEKYGGFIRHILLKDLEGEINEHPNKACNDK